MTNKPDQLNGTEKVTEKAKSLSRREVLTALGGITGAALAGTALPGLAYAVPVYGSPLNAGNTARVVTVSEIRTATAPIPGGLYYVSDAGKEGFFEYDSADTMTPDDTGSVLVSSTGERYKRLSAKTLIDVRWFGATGDGTTNDAAAIGRAVSFAQSFATSDVKPVLYFPPSAGFAVQSTISVPNNIHVIMESPLIYKGTLNEPCLVVGTPAGTDNKELTHKLQVVRDQLSDWTSEACVGVKIVNAVTSVIHVVKATNFTIGVQCIGEGRGFAYNQVNLGYIVNNKIGVDLTNRKPATFIGWCNENLFFGGRFAVESILSTKDGQGRIGVRVTTQDGTNVNNNNNVFHKPSFELNGAKAAPEEGLPILIENGLQNRFTDIRNEGNSAVTMRVKNASANNVVEQGYTNGGSSTLKVDDQSAAHTTFYTERITRLTDFATPIFLSGNLREKACYYDGASSVHIAGVSQGLYTGSTVNVARPLNLADAYVECAASAQGAIGIFADTSYCKRFVVKKSCESGFGGRVVIVCYDASGAIMADPGTTPANPWVYASPGVFWVATQFGGSYKTNSDSQSDLYFQVKPEVQSIRIMFWLGNSALRLQSFSLYTLDARSTRVWSGTGEPTGDTNMATTVPSAGTWPKGKYIANATPAVLGTAPSRYIVNGWRKVTTAATNVLGTDWVEARAPIE